MTFPTACHTTILKHPFLAILKSETNSWGEQEAAWVGQILSEFSKFPLHGISNGIYWTQIYLMNSNFCLFLGTGSVLVLTREWVGQGNIFFDFLKFTFHRLSNIIWYLWVGQEVSGTGQNIFGFKTLLPWWWVPDLLKMLERK